MDLTILGSVLSAPIWMLTFVFPFYVENKVWVKNLWHTYRHKGKRRNGLPFNDLQWMLRMRKMPHAHIKIAPHFVGFNPDLNDMVHIRVAAPEPKWDNDPPHDVLGTIRGTPWVNLD